MSRIASILLVAVTVSYVLLNNSLATTAAYYSDTETASLNSVQAWTASLWTQTYEPDFNAGILNSVDTAAYPDNVVLATAPSEPSTSIGAEQSWYYSAWSRRVPVTITNTGTSQTDYQVRISVTYDGDMQADFDDIRFVDSDGITPLYHCSETVTESTSAVFWVKIPSIPYGVKTIYMYYGNPTVDNACDGDATFLFYDNFGGSNLNEKKWSIWSATASVSGSVVTINNTGSWGGIASQIGFTLPYRFICSVQKTTTNGLAQAGLEHWYSSTGDDTLHSLNVWGGGRQEIYYTSKYDGSEEWDEIGTWDLNTWYHLEIRGETDHVRYYRDGGLRNDETNTSAIPTGPMEILFSSASTGDQMLVDYCFVAKYADPEPTASVGAEEGWSRYAPVTINNPISGLTGYQVCVNVPYDSDMQSDFDDIRFFDSDGVTPLSHWRESYIASTSAVFWVKIPSLPSGLKLIYLCYGDSGAGTASDGDGTFEFYDDFEDGNISDWIQYGNGTVQIANDGGNMVLLKTAYNDKNGGYSLFNNGAIGDFEVTFRTKRINENGGSQNRYGIEDSSFNGYGPRMYDFNSLPSNFGIERRTGGSSNNTVYKSTSAYEWNTWMTVVFRKIGSTLEFELYGSSGSLVESISTTDSTYGIFDRFVVHGGWEYYTDDIRVRKLATGLSYVSSGTLASQVLDTGIAGATWDGLFWDETGTTADWYNNNWSYRRVINLSPVTPEDNFQVLVTLTTPLMGSPYTNVNSDGSDIRFTGPDKVTPQDYWIESWDNTGTSYIWVEVTSAATSEIYLYYGNAAAGSASNGAATFEFFDDFSGDLSQWSIDAENTDKVYIDNTLGNSAPALRHDPDSSQTKNGYFDTRLMTLDYTMENGVIEYDVFLAGSARIIHQLGFRVNSLSFTNGYCWRMQNSTADGGWFRFNNGSWTKIGDNWGPTTGGVWHNVKMTINNSDFTAYVDDSGAIAVSDSIKQTEDYLVSHVHGVSLTTDSYVLVDNVRVRKYAAVEPTAALGTEENKPARVMGITFEVRASDTPFSKDDTSLTWIPVGGTSPVITGLPAGRYKQWRVTLTTSDTGNTPVLHEVRLYYY